jgi:hypothetical protein
LRKRPSLCAHSGDTERQINSRGERNDEYKGTKKLDYKERRTKIYAKQSERETKEKNGTEKQKERQTFDKFRN